MAKLLMLQGLQGSGKSTYAKALEADGWVRTNKDDIRAAMRANGWTWSQEGEKDIIAKQDIEIRTALCNGKDVVVDDTNFGRKHKVRLSQLARDCNAQFDIHRMDVPLDICLARNSTREGYARVPDDVIRKTYRQFVVNDPEHFPLSAPPREMELVKVQRDSSLPSAIICDLDGTISMFDEKGHRGPYNATKCDEDDLNETIARLVCLYDSHDLAQILYVSGREAIYRPQTVKFLTKHGMPSPEDNRGNYLFMRPEGDTRKDWIVKYELFNTHIRGKWDVEFVLDDRDQVVKMWRQLGLTCLQVADGAF